MSRSESSRFPVTVTRLPVTRCEVCGRTLAYRPGQASTVLTQHYNRVHPEALTWIVVGDLSVIETNVRKLDIGEVKVLDTDGHVLR